MNDGGCAFPEVFSTYSNEDRVLTDVYSAGGMSLRDYFAAHAVTECIRIAADQTPGDKPLLSDLMGKAAAYSYALADAMLKQRAIPAPQEGGS